MTGEGEATGDTMGSSGITATATSIEATTDSTGDVTTTSTEDSTATTDAGSGSDFDFALSRATNAVSVVQSESAPNTITATLSSGEPSAVSFSASVSPDEPSITVSSFSPTSCNPTCSTMVSISTDSSTPGGSYVISVIGTGGSPAVTKSTDFTLEVIVPDTLAPTVSISSPAPDMTYLSCETVTITATAEDDVEVTKVEFFLDDMLAWTDMDFPYSYDWLLTTADNGTHNWTAKAYDAAGNSSVSTAISVIAAGPIAYWKLDETSGDASDACGNGYSGKRFPGDDPPVWMPTGGKLGGGLQFDGINDYVSIPDDSALETQTAMTVAVWIKYTSTGAWQNIAEKDHSVDPWRGWYLSIDEAGNGNMEPGFRISNTAKSLFGTGIHRNMNPDTWYHIVATKDGSSLAIYLDDSNEGIWVAGTFNGTLLDADRPMLMGSAAPGDNSSRFRGTIDELRIYDRVLSPEEITQLYQFAGR